VVGQNFTVKVYRAISVKKWYRTGLKVYFDYLPQEDHATVTHQAVFNAFRLLYPANR
jgi:predicted alpha/beta superfamily hydrolase